MPKQVQRFRYEIHPAIGVARVGNSPEAYYLAPDRIGGLPTEVDRRGRERPVRQFKDAQGRIKRQAARFRVFRYDESQPDAPPVEITLASPGVQSIEWTVHVANKKAAWWNFLPLIGDVMLGPENTYENAAKNPQMGLTKRNDSVRGKASRQELIIDPGPRTVSGVGAQAFFTKDTAPMGYKATFPEQAWTQGWPIVTLGEARTDAQGRLLVLGGHGLAGGDTDISSYAGADTWYDDVSDGQINCTIKLNDGSSIEGLKAWVIVGSPKFAPELVNIVTLDDIAFDVAVRYQNLLPDLCYRDPATRDPYEPGRFNPNYVANYQRDIEPIIRRPLDYVWVANVPSMVAFAAPPFDPTDSSPRNRRARREFFAYFRRPGNAADTNPDDPATWGPADQPINHLWHRRAGGSPEIPLMPHNSGSNSVRNYYIDKFLTLTPTQYFLLGQWAEGKFTVDRPAALSGVHPLDQVSIGNCVGAPMCPGIEVTWSLRNPHVYERPYHIRHAHDEAYYFKHGLDPDYDETLKPTGCEPGDLTKRMAIPWQADFFNCTAQFVNFTEVGRNKDESLIPIPPTYYAYWWPPQSPMFVVPGPLSPQAQQVEGVPAGFQVYYQRGINSYSEIIEGWSYLAFLLNTNTGPGGRHYPYVVETERNNDAFTVVDVAVGGPGNQVNPTDLNFWPMWFFSEQARPQPEPPGEVQRRFGRLKAAPGTPRVHPDVYKSIFSGHPVRRPKRGDHR